MFIPTIPPWICTQNLGLNILQIQDKLVYHQSKSANLLGL